MAEFYCRICKSPFRYDVEKLLQEGVFVSEIIKMIQPHYPGVSEQSLRSSITIHYRKKHPPLPSAVKLTNLAPITVNPPEKLAQNDNEDLSKSKTITLDDYARTLLEKGNDPEIIKKLTPAAILQAQKLLLERDKVKIQNNQLMGVLKKLMAGLITEDDYKQIRVMEKEVEDEEDKSADSSKHTHS